MACCTGTTIDGTCADSGGGTGETLQAAYDASTPPLIVLDVAQGGIVIQDGPVPVGGPLFDVQNSVGVSVFNVTPTGATVDGKLTVTGLIDPTGTVYDQQATTPGGVPAANKGTVWVSDTGPQTNLMYTSDSGTVYQMTPIAISLLTTKGDLLTHDTTVDVRLPVGANNTILIADSTAADGIKWGIVDLVLPLTTKGDILVFSTVDTRLPVGVDATILTADSTQATGLKWNTLTSILPLTTKGDLLVNNGTTDVRLGVGANNTILIADSTQATGIKWGIVDLVLPLTTKGDILVFSTVDTRLPVGVDATILTADSTQATGLKWNTLTSILPLTTKGDLLVFSTVDTRLPVGVDATILTADSTQVTGLKWNTLTSILPLTTKGDILVFSTVDTRLGVGTDGFVLSADSTQATGLKWNSSTAILPLTTKGDLLINNGTTNVRLPIGTNGYVLMPDSTLANGGGWRILFTNIVRVDKTGSDATGAVNGLPFLTLAAAIAVATSGTAIWVYPGTYAETLTITVPNGVSIVGFGKKASIINYTAAGAATYLTMGTNCLLTGLSINLISAAHATLNTVSFTGTSNINSFIYDCYITVNNSTAGVGTSDTTCVISTSTGVLDTTVAAINNCDFQNTSVSSGTKRGFYFLTNSHQFVVQNAHVNVTGAASAVGVENAEASTVTFRYCSFDCLTNSVNSGGGLVNFIANEFRFTPTATFNTNAIQIAATSNQLVFCQTFTSTFNVNQPAANRIITFADPLGNDSVVYLAATQTLSNKTLASPATTGTISMTSTPAITAVGNLNISATGGGDIILNPSSSVQFSSKTASLVSAIQLTGASNQIQFQPGNAGNILILNSTNPATTNRVVTFQDPGANCNVIYSVLAQTIGGVKTFTSGIFLPTAGGTASSFASYEESNTNIGIFTWGAVTTGNVPYSLTQNGRIVNFYIPGFAIGGTQNSTIVSSAGIPTRFIPATIGGVPNTQVTGSFFYTVGGVYTVGKASLLQATGVLTLTTSNNGNFNGTTFTFDCISLTWPAT